LALPSFFWIYNFKYSYVASGGVSYTPNFAFVIRVTHALACGYMLTFAAAEGSSCYLLMCGYGDVVCAVKVLYAVHDAVWVSKEKSFWNCGSHAHVVA